MSAVATRERSLEERLDLWLAADPAVLADPYSLFEDVRAAGRVVFHRDAAFLTRHADVKEVIRGNERFSRQAMSRSNRALEIRAALTPEQGAAFDEISAIQERTIGRTDGELHTRLRGIVHRAFTPKRIVEVGPPLQRHVDKLLDAEEGRDAADLERLAYGLPLFAVCHLLGIPETDQDMIHEWSLRIGANQGNVHVERMMAAHAAYGEFHAYVLEIIERHRRQPGSAGDLVATLLDAEEGDRLTPDELSATFIVLLVAGHDSTTNLLSHGVRELLVRPGLWQELVDSRSLLPNAVEELLRYVAPVQFVFRYALEDFAIGDDVIPAGTVAYPVVPAANRDPGVFDDPLALDLRRANASMHLSLGFGPYFCLGASLARLEVTTALGSLLDRYPRMELAEAEPPSYGGSAMLRRLEHVPVVLEP